MALISMHITLWAFMGLFRETLTLNGELFKCADRSNSNLPLLYKAGETMRICCDVKPLYCLKGLQIHRKNLGTDQNRYSATADTANCTIELAITNATVADNGLYICSTPNGTLSSTSVFVIERPANLSLESFSFGFSRKIKVEFKTGELNAGLRRDKYTVRVKKSRAPRRSVHDGCSATVCGLNASQADCDERFCTCEAQLAQCVLEDFNLNLTLSALRNPYDPVETEFVVNSVSHIRPDDDVKLMITDIKAHIAEGRITLSRNMVTLYSFMEFKQQPLWFNVSVEKLDGTWKISFELDAVNHGLDVNFFTLKSLSFKLNGLTPHTNYSVHVVNHGGGGPGLPTTHVFTTAQIAPRTPPVMYVYDFARYNTGDDTDKQILYLQWQTLPVDDRGGDNLTYVIEVLDPSNDELMSQSTVGASPLELNVPAIPLLVKIWAQNNIGRSANFNLIAIPSLENVNIATHAEFYQDGHMATIHSEVQGDVAERFAVHFCPRKKSLQFCEDYPVTNIVHTKTNVLHFDLNLEKYMITNTTFEKRTLEGFNIYECDFNGTNTIFQNKSLINATVEKNIALYHTQGTNHSQNVFGRLPVTGIQEAKPSLFQPVVEATILVSVMVGGLWSGMHLTSCYYDRSRDNLLLDINEVESWLVWQQQCDKERPQQFLANHFRYYSSHNESCITDDNAFELLKIDNPVFTQAKTTVTEKAVYACIKTASSPKSDGSIWTSGPKAYYINPNNVLSKYEDSSIPVTVGILSAFIIIAIVCLVIWKCRSSHKYIMNGSFIDMMTEDYHIHTIKGEMPTVVSDSIDGNHPTIVPLSQIVESSDSGHITCVNSTGTHTSSLDSFSSPTSEFRIKLDTQSLLISDPSLKQFSQLPSSNSKRVENSTDSQDSEVQDSSSDKSFDKRSVPNSTNAAQPPLSEGLQAIQQCGLDFVSADSSDNRSIAFAGSRQLDSSL